MKFVSYMTNMLGRKRVGYCSLVKHSASKQRPYTAVSL